LLHLAADTLKWTPVSLVLVCLLPLSASKNLWLAYNKILTLAEMMDVSLVIEFVIWDPFCLSRWNYKDVLIALKRLAIWTLMAHAYNSRYLGGWDWEDCSSRSAQAQDPFSTEKNGWGVTCLSSQLCQEA
jgi:hypothetical protein